MRPRGTPPTPTAASRLSEVVEIAGISDTSRSPSRIIDPLPNLFSMFAKAASTALPRSALVRSSAMAYISFFRSSSQSEQIITQCFICATVNFRLEGEVFFDPREVHVNNGCTLTYLVNHENPVNPVKNSPIRLTSSGLPAHRSISATIADPTTTASAYRLTSATCAAFEIPNPTAIGSDENWRIRF